MNSSVLTSAVLASVACSQTASPHILADCTPHLARTLLAVESAFNQYLYFSMTPFEPLDFWANKVSSRTSSHFTSN